MQIIRVSRVRVKGSEDDQFIGRLAQAEAESWVNDRKLIDAMLNRGASRRTPRRKSLAERDSDWS